MSKNVLKRMGYNVTQTENELKFFYRNHYFNLYMNMFGLKGAELTPQRIKFFKTKLWSKGTCSASLSKVLNELVFASYGIIGYDIDDFPKAVNLLDINNSGQLKEGELIVDEDVVIWFAMDNEKPISSMVDVIINKIVEVELTINVNLYAHNMPFIITGDSIDKDKLTNLIKKIIAHEPWLFTDVSDVDKISNLVNNTPYIIDKLTQYLQYLDGQILTLFGIDNNPVEKKEREITDEVNANNDKITYSGNCIIKNVEIFFEKVKDVLGKEVEVISNMKEVKSVHEAQTEEDDPGEDTSREEE